MPPIYTGKADEWSIISSSSSGSSMSYELIIDNFELHMDRGRRGDCLRSPNFTLKETVWHIEVDPRSQDDDEGSGSEDEDQEFFVSVGIVNDNNDDLMVNCSFVAGDKTKQAKGQTIESDSNYWWSKFMSHEECIASLDDGKFKLKLFIELLEEEMIILSMKISTTT